MTNTKALKRNRSSERKEFADLRSNNVVNGCRWRILTIGGTINVRLTSCVTGLDLTKQVKLIFNIRNASESKKINRRSSAQ